MQADIADGADRNCRAGRVDGHAAAVGVSDGGNTIDVWESWKNLRLDAMHRIVHGGRDALHGGRNSQNVFRPGRAIAIAVPIEGVAFERRLLSGDCGGEWQPVERGRGGHLKHVLANPASFRDCTRGESDGLPESYNRFIDL